MTLPSAFRPLVAPIDSLAMHDREKRRKYGSGVADLEVREGLREKTCCEQLRAAVSSRHAPLLENKADNLIDSQPALQI